MAQFDEWDFIEEWHGQSPDEILENIQRKAKEHIVGVEKAVNELNKVVRSCKDWQRNLLFGLCPECRARHTPKNTAKPKTECPINTDIRRTEKLNEKALLSRILTFFHGSGKNTGNIKDKDSSSVDINGQQSSEVMSRSIEDLQLLLEAKESAYKNSSQKTESENENLKNDIAKLREENEMLQLRVSSAVRDLKKTQEDTARVVVDKEKITAEMRLCSEEWKAIQIGSTEQITDLTNRLTEIKKQIRVLENDLDTKDEELRMVKKELAEAKRPRVKDMVLGIRSERSGMGKTMIEMVNRELSGQLQNILEKENVRLTVKQCAAATDVPKGLMAVLCLDMSRVGTNIKDALAGIKVNRDVFVIVFHHTSKDNLSSLTPTSLRITGSELRQLGAIIDMVFSSDSGIYECDLNTTAVANIAALITKYS